ESLRRTFRMEVTRTQRRSDGTVTVEGVRFEVPSAYRTLLHLRLRVARWDLSSVELVDGRKGTHLATLLPLDKLKNADRKRCVFRSTRPPIPAASGHPFQSTRARSERSDGLDPIGAKRRSGSDRSEATVWIRSERSDGPYQSDGTRG